MVKRCILVNETFVPATSFLHLKAGEQVQTWKVKTVDWSEMDSSECAVKAVSWAVTEFWVNFDIKTGEGAQVWLSVDVNFWRTA